MAVLLAGGVVYGGLSLLRGGEQAAARPSPTASPTSSPTEASSDAPEPTPTPSAATTEVPEPQVDCWDGTRVADLSECEAPAGRKGLKWIFPGLDPSRCDNIGSSGARLRQLRCHGVLSDGTVVRLQYSEWSSAGAGHAAYDGQNWKRREEVDNNRIQWWLVSRAGDYKTVLMYRNAPWSVTVYAPTAKTRAEAVRTLVEMRDAGAVFGAMGG